MKTLFLACLLLITGLLYGQKSLITPPNGGNKKATISEQVGLTDITIRYNRPAVKGREGKIWGEVVQPGFLKLPVGNANSSPWRAGANETTVIEFSRDVTIEGHPVKAGKYGFYVAYGREKSILIFSQDYTSWGSFFYDPKKDVLRVEVQPIPLSESVERMRFDFTNQTENATTIQLQWEKLALPFRVETDYIQHQLEMFRKELMTDKGFVWGAWWQAAQWCLDRNVNLEEALMWSDTSISAFLKGRSFQTLLTRSKILDKLGKATEAAATMKDAVNLGTMNEVHQYARQLLDQKKNDKALEVFKLNFEKYPDQYGTTIGLARGYSAIGDYKKALEMAEKALPISPEGPSRAFTEKAISSLKAGNPIN